MTTYKPKLCDKCTKTFEHSEHQRCSGCGARVPVPLNMLGFTNSIPYCDNCPDDSESGNFRDRQSVDYWRVIK